ncbi:hypothetical protein BDV93DRAFT_567377 [Ceratobasidium sp. AG-I]|nr:hypothetical protein BDV93DRAFT_567377 [Ceratobasidium sp. AG-I]
MRFDNPPSHTVQKSFIRSTITIMQGYVISALHLLMNVIVKQDHLAGTYKSSELCKEEPLAPTIQSDVSCVGASFSGTSFTNCFPAMKRVTQSHPPATIEQLEMEHHPIAIGIAKIL